jgi:hypothetical protein
VNSKNSKTAMMLALVGLQTVHMNSSAAEPALTQEKQPTIEFVYPHPNDVVADYPIYIETKVTNCTLEPPVQYWSGVEKVDESVGHIHYTLDNSPIFATKNTKVVMTKPTGKTLPPGKHVLRAEIVYINHERRQPPVFVEIPITCERPKQTVSSQSPDVPMTMDDRTLGELQAVEKQLKDVQEELAKLKSQGHHVPNP